MKLLREEEIPEVSNRTRVMFIFRIAQTFRCVQLVSNSFLHIRTHPYTPSLAVVLDCQNSCMLRTPQQTSLRFRSQRSSTNIIIIYHQKKSGTADFSREARIDLQLESGPKERPARNQTRHISSAPKYAQTATRRERRGERLSLFGKQILTICSMSL